MAITLSPKGIESEKPSVLILDDEIKVCALIKKFLELSNLFKNVVVANSVSIAIMKIRNEKFDLVIVDYNLPDKKGTVFIDIISKAEATSQIKFLLISGFLDNKTINEIINLRVSQVLVKPFTRMMLLKKVCDILKISLPTK